MTLALGEDEVDVWYARVAAEPAAAVERRAATILSAAEREQHARFHFARDRALYLTTRVLVRTVLSAYAPVAPERWAFARNRFGRPHIAAPGPAPPLAFNLSHTAGLIVCAVARFDEIGIDVEPAQGPHLDLEIAERFFAPAEADELRALEPAARRERLYAYWTLKEAYAKARGIGLASALDAATFACRDGEPIAARTLPADDRAEGWQFFGFRFAPHYRMSVAMRPRRGGVRTVRLRRFA